MIMQSSVKQDIGRDSNENSMQISIFFLQILV